MKPMGLVSLQIRYMVNRMLDKLDGVTYIYLSETKYNLNLVLYRSKLLYSMQVT